MQTPQTLQQGEMMQQHTSTPEGQGGGEAHGARQLPQQEATAQQRAVTLRSLFTRGAHGGWQPPQQEGQGGRETHGARQPPRQERQGAREAHAARQLPQQEAQRASTLPNLFTRGHMEDGNLHKKKANIEEDACKTATPSTRRPRGGHTHGGHALIKQASPGKCAADVPLMCKARPFRAWLLCQGHVERTHLLT